MTGFYWCVFITFFGVHLSSNGSVQASVGVAYDFNVDNGGSFVGAIAKASLVDFWNIFITLYIHYFLIIVFYVCISIPFFCLGSSPLRRLLNYCTPSSDNTCISGPAASSVLITPTKLTDISCEISVCSAF